MEIFPGVLFGKTWILGNKSGIFPRQANGPGMYDKNGKLVSAQPMAAGKQLTVAPDDQMMRLTISSSGSDLQLIDGRYIHNNGWFVVKAARYTRGN